MEACSREAITVVGETEDVVVVEVAHAAEAEGEAAKAEWDA